MHWTADYRFVADDPAKATRQGMAWPVREVLEALAPAMQGRTRQITIISPYFVPGKDGTKCLVGRWAAESRCAC